MSTLGHRERPGLGKRSCGNAFRGLLYRRRRNIPARERRRNGDDERGDNQQPQGTHRVLLEQRGRAGRFIVPAVPDLQTQTSL
jgi:hypothetical protein